MKSCKNIITLTVLSTALIGCGWVDSTGDQGSRNNGSSATSSVQLVDGSAVILNEASTTSTTLQNAPRTVSTWSWRAENSNVALSLCQSQEGFDGDVAVQQLDQACTSDTNCAISVQDFSANGTTAFDVTLPELKAPVALSYSIETTLNDGDIYRHQQIICGVAINEAPTVNENEYLAITNNSRVVYANDAYAVFSGATDDVHVRNQPLFIKQVTTNPQYAENLNVLSDGTFRYTPQQGLGLSNSDYLDDSFKLLVSDGVHDVETTVRIRLVNFNSAPYVVSTIPDYSVSVEDETPVELELDLSEFFSDVDGNTLKLRVQDNPLIQSGALSFSEAGFLQGELTLDDAGTYQFSVFANDGLYEVSDNFTLTVGGSQPQNQAPIVTDIRNARVNGAFSYALYTFFSDPDGDTLTYSANNLPPGVNLSDSGVITGIATAQNEGRWLIQITASDNRGGNASDQFRLTIDY